jgi:hypothetical protein
MVLSPVQQAKRPLLLRPGKSGVAFRRRFTPANSNMNLLSCGEYDIPPQAESQEFGLPREEALLFQWKGDSSVVVDGQPFSLAPYDTLYIPRGTGFRLTNPTTEPSRIVQTSAPAENVHPACHCRFAEISQREDRIRQTGERYWVGDRHKQLFTGTGAPITT